MLKETLNTDRSSTTTWDGELGSWLGQHTGTVSGYTRDTAREDRGEGSIAGREFCEDRIEGSRRAHAHK